MLLCWHAPRRFTVHTPWFELKLPEGDQLSGAGGGGGGSGGAVVVVALCCTPAPPPV